MPGECSGTGQDKMPQGKTEFLFKRLKSYVSCEASSFATVYAPLLLSSFE